ncbi:Hint domain-containing protein [Roseovarius aestuariivivens]|uniref:Hint domain-containing protein n=1 Tax=Roseovarius aestuariivivens TaxID=1888910 RepID=UPI0010811E20|nr:Hint domain-containing protein [Roseovarius aestuariivivens]
MATEVFDFLNNDSNASGTVNLPLQSTTSGGWTLDSSVGGNGDDELVQFETTQVSGETAGGDPIVLTVQYVGLSAAGDPIFAVNSVSAPTGYSAIEGGDVFILSASDVSGTSVTPASTGSYTVCFAAGTLIARPDGETAVEDLEIGDLVMTADGNAVPVKWVGRQTVHKIFTPAERFEPVRVTAGALGQGLPHRDLVLTADHALILDGLAVNAGALENGTTILRESKDTLPDRVTYYHIETENHDVILANGAPAETYIDYVGRRAFDNHAEYLALYGDEPVIAEMPLPRVSSRRQLPEDLRARFGIADFADDVTAEALAFLVERGAA